MRLTIIAVGRASRGPEDALAAEYQKRLAGFGGPAGLGPLDVKMIATRPDLGRDVEAEKLLAAATSQGADWIVALDERGETPGSAALAKTLAQRRDAGVRRGVFLIGGADGHGAAALAAAHWRLSLGPMTWPHALVRAMLAEQLYRAAAILAGHPYHRA